MSTPNQQAPEINESQRRINNILMGDSFLLISGSGEVVSQNIGIEGIWPLLETVKFSLLSQYMEYCIDQRLNAGSSASQHPGSSGS